MKNIFFKSSVSLCSFQGSKPVACSLKLVAISILVFVSVVSTAQEKKTDTVKVSLAKTSQVVFTMKDRSDLETLKHYDFQNLFQDILTKLEKSDTSGLSSDTSNAEVVVNIDEDDDSWRLHRADRNNDNNNNNDNGDHWNWNDHHHGHHGRTSQSFNFDLGTNNYLSNGKFPDSNNEIYSVRPWGSWYVGLSSIQRTRLANKFFLEWGAGISWYNFKFQNDKALMQKDDNGVSFIEDPRSTDPNFDFTKSKLTATYINATLIPVIDFGGSRHKQRMWDGGDSFRIGLGPYIGYRIESHSKQVYTNEGDKKKDHNRDSFYLNNIRYGARLQLGFRSTDFFFNYDMNELFTSGKGPSLNAFSFGIVF